MAHDVFVSYSSQDKVVADGIVASLENNHIRCWYAPRDIKPGQDWGETIAKAIEDCRIFLIIFSGNANRSQRVLDEVNLAIDGEAVLIPFRIENLEPKGAMKLHLSSRHWLDAFEPSWQSHIKNLIQDVAANLDSEISENDIEVPESVRKREGKPKSKFLIPASIIIGTILVTAGWFGYSFLKKQNALGAAQSEVVSTPSQAEQPTLQEQDDEVKSTSTPTPIPDWVTEISDPIFTAIQNNPPYFSDDFYGFDDNWSYKLLLLNSDIACESTSGASIEATGGELKGVMTPLCPQFEISHTKMKNLENYVLQVDIDFNGKSYAKVEFRTFYQRENGLFLFLDSSGESLLIRSENGDSGSFLAEKYFTFDNSKPITVTIIHTPPIFLVYIDSTLLISRIDLDKDFGPGNLSLNIICEGLTDREGFTNEITIEFDNLNVWNLDLIDF